MQVDGSAGLDRDLLRSHVQKRGKKRHSEGRHRSILHADIERDSSHHSVFVGGNHGVSESRGLLRKRRSRAGDRNHRRKWLEFARSHDRPGLVEGTGYSRPVFFRLIGGLDIQGVDDASGRPSRLDEHRITGRSAASWRAGPADVDIKPHHRGAGSTQRRQDSRKERMVPRFRSEAGLPRLVACDDDQRRTRRNRCPMLQPDIVERPIQSAEGRGSQEPYAQAASRATSAMRLAVVPLERESDANKDVSEFRAIYRIRISRCALPAGRSVAWPRFLS